MPLNPNTSHCLLPNSVAVNTFRVLTINILHFLPLYAAQIFKCILCPLLIVVVSVPIMAERLGAQILIYLLHIVPIMLVCGVGRSIALHFATWSVRRLSIIVAILLKLSRLSAGSVRT